MIHLAARDVAYRGPKWRRAQRRGDAMQDHSLALDIKGLSKTFDRPAVNSLDLAVRAGEFYALLGPNGAGKTTLLRMVAGLLQPDTGSISVLGIDARRDPIAAKRVIAWVSDEPMVYDRLTPLEYLQFVAGLWQMPADEAEANAHALVDWLGLGPHANERCGGFLERHAAKSRPGWRPGARTQSSSSSTNR